MVGNNIRERYVHTSDNTVKKKDKSPWGPSTSLLYYSVVLVLSSLFAWIFSRQCSSHFSSPLSPVLLARQVSKFSRKEEWQGKKKGNKVHTIRHFVRFDGLEFICTFFSLLSLYGHYIILLATKNNTDSFLPMWMKWNTTSFWLLIVSIYIHTGAVYIFVCTTETFASSYSMTISTFGQENHQRHSIESQGIHLLLEERFCGLAEMKTGDTVLLFFLELGRLLVDPLLYWCIRE